MIPWGLLGLHDTVGSVRPRRDTQRLCSTLSHILIEGYAAHHTFAFFYLWLLGFTCAYQNLCCLFWQHPHQSSKFLLHVSYLLPHFDIHNAYPT
jgi:hypothetical protein